jgi:hypothetical protein
MVYAAEDKTFCKVLTPEESNKELHNLIFNFDCQKTTANKDFCSCLSEKLPATFDFKKYVETATLKGSEVNRLSVMDKATYDMTSKIRDFCISAYPKANPLLQPTPPKAGGAAEQ